MKILVAACLIACAVYVYGESCTTNDNCMDTQCATGSHVVCEHQQDVGVIPGGGLCTCAKDDLFCSGRDACLAIKDTMNCNSDRSIHCFDNKCICSRFPQG